MIAKLIGAMSMGGVMLLGAATAYADHGGDPIEYHEPVFYDNIGVGQVYEASFPTEVVPNRGKFFGLSGGFYNLQSMEPINFTVWLTWFDPRLPSGQQSNAPESYEIPPIDQVSVSTYVTVPFTPERVGVHIQNDGPGEPLLVSAFLNHVTTRVPEPSAVALIVIGFLSAVGARRRTWARHSGT